MPTKKKDLKSLFRGFTNEKGEYSETVQIPTYVEKIYLYSESLGVPMVTVAGIFKGKKYAIPGRGDEYVYSTCPGWYQENGW